MKRISLLVLIFALSGCTGFNMYKEPIPININQDKIVDEERLEIYNNIIKEYKHATSNYRTRNNNYESDIEEAFGIPFSEDNKIELNGKHTLYFKVGNGMLSKTKIPDKLESLGLTGIKKILKDTENNQVNNTLSYETNDIVTPNKTYKSDAPLVNNFSYYIKNDIVVRFKYSKQNNNIINSMLSINFGNVFSVPAQYEQLTASIIDNENFLNNYFVGGKKEQLVFMNLKYLDYSIDGNLGYYFGDGLIINKERGTPIACILYGNNGEINKIRIMIIRSEGFNFESQNYVSCQKYLSAINLSDEGKDKIIKLAEQFIAEKLPTQKGDLENYNYEISQRIGGGYGIPQNSKIVELVIYEP